MATTIKTRPAPFKSGMIRKPSPKQAYMAFLVLLGINILNYTDRSVLTAVGVGTAIQKEFLQHQILPPDTLFGLLISSFLLAYGILTLPLGIWADRGVRKNIVAICVTVWSCATACVGLTRHFIQLIFLRSVLGVG